MKTSKVILATLLVLAVGAVAAIAMRDDEQPAPPQPVDPSTIPAWMLGAALAEGWDTYAWYSYKGNSNEMMWIRVDKGPPDPGYVVTDLPWRWTIFVDRPGLEGQVPIATGEKSWMDLTIAYDIYSAIEAVNAYSEAEMGQLVARAAADQIDTMYEVES